MKKFIVLLMLVSIGLCGFSWKYYDIVVGDGIWGIQDDPESYTAQIVFTSPLYNLPIEDIFPDTGEADEVEDEIGFDDLADWWADLESNDGIVYDVETTSEVPHSTAGTLTVDTEAGYRVWETYYDAWDNMDDITFNVSGGDPNTFYQVQIRFALSFSGSLENEDLEVTAWSPWYVRQRDYIYTSLSLYNESHLTPVGGDHVTPSIIIDGNGNGSGTLRPLGIWQTGSTEPTSPYSIPGTVDRKLAHYCGHGFDKYLVEIRMCRVPTVTEWIIDYIDGPNGPIPVRRPGTVRVYEPSGHDILWIEVDTSGRPDPPGPPGGSGMG